LNDEIENPAKKNRSPSPGGISATPSWDSIGNSFSPSLAQKSAKKLDKSKPYLHDFLEQRLKTVFHANEQEYFEF
jgi:hypothetical protein